MKSSPLESSSAENVVDSKPSIWKRFTATVKQFKRDCREPLPGTAELTRWGKLKARSVHLFRRYGWKLLVAIILYYLIRDGILYILIPYLVAKQLID